MHRHLKYMMYLNGFILLCSVDTSFSLCITSGSNSINYRTTVSKITRMYIFWLLWLWNHLRLEWFWLKSSLLWCYFSLKKRDLLEEPLLQAALELTAKRKKRTHKIILSNITFCQVVWMYVFIYLFTLPKLIENILDSIFVFTMTNCDKLDYNF